MSATITHLIKPTQAALTTEPCFSYQNGSSSSDHELFRAFCDLPCIERLIIATALSGATERGGRKGVPIGGRSLEEIAGLQKSDNASLSPTLKAAVKKLFARKVSCTQGVFMWMWQFEIPHDSDVAWLFFSPKIELWFEKLSKNFTEQQIIDIAKLSSFYSAKIFSMVVGDRPISCCHISITDIREELGIGHGKYKTTGELWKHVVSPAIRDIREKSKMKINALERKEGRKIVGWDFQVSYPRET